MKLNLQIMATFIAPKADALRSFGGSVVRRVVCEAGLPLPGSLCALHRHLNKVLLLKPLQLTSESSSSLFCSCDSLVVDSFSSES
jgi:hypothetical protein